MELSRRLVSVGHTQSKMSKVLRTPCAPLRLCRRRCRQRYGILLVYATRLANSEQDS